jgi:hypothetical protein
MPLCRNVFGGRYEKSGRYIVKFALEPAMKAQRGSKIIALLFL